MSSTQLAPDQESRARDLHRTSIVFDTMNGGPRLFVRDLVEEAVRRWDEGEDPDIITADFSRDSRRALWRRPEIKQQYAELIERSGLTVGSETVGGAGWSFRSAIKDIAAWREVFDHLPDLVTQVLRPEDVHRAKREGKMGIVFNFQNTTHFENDLANVDLFYGLGVRIVQLTYNDQNSVGTGCTEAGDGGLTRFGRDLVARLNDLGVVVDLSHCGAQTTADTIRLARVAPCITHAACSAVAAHPRNKSDDQIRAVVERGGYFGVLILPMFLTGCAGASIENFFRHLEHAIAVAGIDHVGVGMDWGMRAPDFALPLLDRTDARFMRQAGIKPDITLGGGFRSVTEGIDGVMGWPAITRGLVARGYSDEDIRKILGLNFMRYWERVIAEAR